MIKCKSTVICFICLVVETMFLSCNRRNIERDLKLLIGTKIDIPYDSLFSNGKEKMSLTKENYTYVIYCDSMVCSKCTLKNMYYWEVMKDSISKLKNNVDVIFIFSPSKAEMNSFINDFLNAEMNLTAFVDTSGCFIKSNQQIPHNSNAHAFLLDKEGKVIMVGNAQYNQSIEKLLFKIIQ